MSNNNPLGFDISDPGFGFKKDQNGEWVFDRSIIE
jgi:hypothetical protein